MPFFRGKDFSFDLGKRTYIMGILNITPDSFFDGGKWNTLDKALEHAKQMESDGADIIDIGAQSTKPFHIELSENDELDIVKQYISPLCKAIHVPVSVDTFYPRIAEYCLSNGASIVNDVSGIFNAKMAQVVKFHNSGWIVLHTGGGDAKTVINYKTGVVRSVIEFFEAVQKDALNFGIFKEQLCFDMGIGFGKSNDDNLDLIRNIDKLKTEERAILTALSCKRVISYATSADGEDRKYGTIAADTAAIMGGTDFIRVHDVREAVFAARMADKLAREAGNF